MELFIEFLLAAMIIIVGPIMTLFGLPGNTLMLGAGLIYAFMDEARYFDGRIIALLILIYVFGELWEFVVSFFGIKRQSLPWKAVFIIGLGTFAGAILGTGFFPILGSFLGAALGSFVMAFLYEYLRSDNKDEALRLAWAAVKIQCFALMGKFIAAAAMAVLLVKQLFLNFG